MTSRGKMRKGAYQADEECRTASIPSSIRLEPRVEGESSAVDALCLEALVKAEICDSNTKPRHEPSDGGHAGKPIENFSRTRHHGHKGEKGE